MRVIQIPNKPLMTMILKLVTAGVTEVVNFQFVKISLICKIIEYEPLQIKLFSQNLDLANNKESCFSVYRPPEANKFSNASMN